MPKGCMISHDNLVWFNVNMKREGEKEKPGASGPHNRIVSYLPLSHIAGLQVDIISPMVSACQVYFAKPDALSGTLVDTLKHARPTIFVGVPRVWEKFEDRLKAVGAANPAFM